MDRNNDLDAETINDVLLAFGVLWNFDPYRYFPTEGDSVIFSAAARGPADPVVDYTSLVEQSSMDLVMLEFEPGDESRGPWNVVVCMRSPDGQVNTFPECFLWKDPRKNFMRLVPVGADTALAFDGAAIGFLPLPPKGEMSAGRASARRKLREAVRQIPTLTGIERRVHKIEKS